MAWLLLPASPAGASVSGTAPARRAPAPAQVVSRLGGEPVTLRWHLFSRLEHGSIRLYRGADQRHLRLLTEERLTKGFVSDEVRDVAPAAGRMIYELRVVDERGQEVVLGAIECQGSTSVDGGLPAARRDFGPGAGVPPDEAAIAPLLAPSTWPLLRARHWQPPAREPLAPPPWPGGRA